MQGMFSVTLSKIGCSLEIFANFHRVVDPDKENGLVPIR